ncbi:hypothetical protein BO71DRAFT_454627 [Aspergillus ellipticus CBS 707.79]|uniref:DUF7703 domain-containing protein n=1 Tax=Aspergillus ellipticus CBS 707.79 TaxID=1448320 RepID=A0A319CYQ5_9EURO|nr:hypothetical protein BO71DRAFT_454627 [Aspergillus ellipticus CBS 707.79]
MANYSAPVEGIAGGYTGDSLAIQAALAALLSCAIYGALELVVIIFFAFHVYRGLYFWSLLITASLGILPQAVGLLLKYFDVGPIWIPVTLSTFGWATMVTGQSVVLYSRLHLIVRNPSVLAFVLYMIIIDAFILQVPQIVFSYGAIYGGPHFSYIYNIWARVQLTGFFVQEIIISTIFIVQTFRLLCTYPQRSKRRTRIMEQLLLINTVIILMDISLLVLEYQDIFILQTSLKTFFYAVKLKLEFAVLSRLVSFVNYDHEQDSSVFS